MRIVKGVVSSNIDPKSSARFSAKFDEWGDDEKPVIYTSPMYRVNGGGILAPPAYEDIILAVYDEDTEEYYYHSTVVDIELATEVSKIPGFKEIGDKNAYSKDGRPVKIQFQNQVGAGIDITKNHRPAPETQINSVTLKSEGGKQIGADDSPGVEAAFVMNQHGDGLIVKGDPDDIYPARCVQIISKGQQDFTVMESSMDLTVVEGRDITIENRSTGAMAQTPSEDWWPNGNLPCKRWGGIYLRSESGDISIAANADTGESEQDGRIFIVTPKARIQITETGAIQIDSTDAIRIKSSSDINMEGANINIKATGSLKMESGGATSILSGGNVDVDGTEIHLKPTSPPEPIPPLSEQSDLDLNDYYE
jgi:hypothetical protein